MITLISLNIEGRTHIDRIGPFLKASTPDVVCLQEVCKQDVPYFEEVLGMQSSFCAMGVPTRWGDELGVAVFAEKLASFQTHIYAGHTGAPQPIDETSLAARYAATRYVLATARIDGADGRSITIGTTHFPVTTRGETTDYQREALHGLFAALDGYEEIVLCGDFNAPRGREIFTKLSEYYTDNIPATYTTSLDNELHRGAPIEFVVDGLFSTDQYRVTNVSLECGLSDHCAVVGNIDRV